MQNSQEIDKKVQDHTKTICDLLETQGALYRYEGENGPEIDHYPFALYPTKIQTTQHLKIKKTYVLWSKLLHKVACNPTLVNQLFSSKEEETQPDHFAMKLLQLYNHAFQDCPQKHLFNIVRNDYLIQKATERIVLIGTKTIAVELSMLSQKVQNTLRDYLPLIDPYLKIDGFPVSHNVSATWTALAKCIQLAGLKGVVVMICNPNEPGTLYDQRHIEFSLAENGLKVKRATFNSLAEKLILDQESRDVFYDGDQVACFYYCFGHLEHHYINQEAWNLRKLIERSNTIKIPNVAYQIVGLKKAQAKLTDMKTIKKVLTEEEAEEVELFMPKLRDFEDWTKHSELIHMCEDESTKFILKSLREAGGDDFYGQDILQTLKFLSINNRRAYILSQKVESQPHPNIIVRRTQPRKADGCVTEHSIFGYIHAYGEEIKENYVTGSIQRIKEETNKQESKAKGFTAVLRSLYLTHS